VVGVDGTHRRWPAGQLALPLNSNGIAVLISLGRRLFLLASLGRFPITVIASPT